MKKQIGVCLLLASLLTACDFEILNSNGTDSNENKTSEVTSVKERTGESPKIRGNKDFKFQLCSEDDEVQYIVVSNYDFIADTKATDAEDGDITSSIKYVVYDYYTSQQVNIIQLSKHRKYELHYSVTDSDGNVASDINFIIVGSPSTMLDSEGNPKEGLNIDDEYEAIQESYRLIFEEDYNYTGAPGTVSTENDYQAYLYQTGGGGWGNGEVQIYEKNDRTCYVSDGNLKISVIKDGDNYYSARLNTTPAFSQNWTYGIYEVYAKLPKGKGTWPAIWMMPNNSSKNGGWPGCGEIDIMETSDYYFNKVLGTVHTKDYNHISGTQKGGNILNSTIYTEYHRYAIEWLPDRIKFYFDETNYFTFNPSYYVNTSVTPINVNMWPFDHPFHFIFNIAMGGAMGGDISPTLFDNGNEIAMYIDKVRVYQSTYVNQKYLNK